ncbi:MAG: SDR family oxidoreductase [Bryobacterales bacterium]|nr:SDR family oxidoreductase [Bryobacteraceae bacterium]MDW8129512.1 SDR family oxidoreductase [Bryobacterales bacterium]
MEQFLGGRTAVVTGGTRGIGYAVAEALLGAGAAVAICGRSEERVRRALASLASKGRVVGQAADVSRWEDVERFFAFVERELGGPDVLVNNAGIGIFAPAAELSPEDWRRTIETNLSGAFYATRAAVPRMRARGGGFIVNISSLAGKNPFAGGAAYNASKFGLNGFSEALMLDYRYEDIRVTTIMPGSVATEFGRGGTDDWKIAPEDIAEIVLFVLRMPPRTLVSRVEVRPSKPRK